MAYTKKTEKKEESVKTNSSNMSNELENFQKENQELKQQLEQMKQTMSSLMNQVALMAQMSQNNNVQKTSIRDIEVVSLTNANLLITTTGRSDGKHYNFTHQFESQPIPENDLKDIVRSMPNTARNGYFYICDEDFVRDNGLYSSYRDILSNIEMKELFQLSSEDFIKNYIKAPKGQKSIIESMIINKKLNGEKVDANIMLELKKYTGKDYMEIEPIVKE